MDLRVFAPLPAALALLVQACSSSETSGEASREPARFTALSEPVKLTDVATLVPTHALSPERIKPSNVVPSVREAQLAEGWGDFAVGPGEATVQSTPDGSPPPGSGAARKRLLRFAFLADFQLPDDESPSRQVAFESGPPFESAFRPHEGSLCRVVNAVVRTVNRIHVDAPLDAVVLGGDNADSAQTNELDWVLALLGGQSEPLACDSGEVDDPVPGPNNDGKDPFVPVGLDVPWYWVTGNHDILNQGNFQITETKIAETIGDSPSVGGTRDYRMPGGPATQDPVPPDPRRLPLSRQGVMGKVLAHTGRSGPEAHGLGAYARQTHKAFYSADLGAPGPGGIRLIAIDTAAETGASQGVLRRGDIDGFVKPELERARTEGKLVIFSSHHASDKLSNGSGLGGSAQPDAITAADWESLLIANPHVIAHFAGHSHEHRVKWIGKGTAGYWEVRSSAIADYPGQFRVVEIWDEDNGMVSIRATSADYVTKDDPVAAEGYKLTLLDFTTRQRANGGTGQPKDRNAVLWRVRP